MTKKEEWALRAVGFLVVTLLFFVWNGFTDPGGQVPAGDEDNPPVSSESSRPTSSVSQKSAPANPQSVSSGVGESSFASSARSRDTNAFSESQAMRRQLAFKEKVQKLGLHNTRDGIAGYVRQSFQKESVDSGWAYDYESSIYEAIADDPTLSALPVEAVECRSTRCRIDLTLSDQDQLVDVSMAITKVMLSGSHGLNFGQTVGDYTPGETTASWFIARDKSVDILDGTRFEAIGPEQSAAPE